MFSLGLDYNTPETFKDLKVYQIFSFHTTPENLKTQQAPVILDLFLRKTRELKSHDDCDVTVFGPP